jgi:hypothetical protein
MNPMPIRDAARVIAVLKAKHPTLSVRHLEVSHPGADDDGLWFFAANEIEVQIESSTGMCPFLVETNENTTRTTTNSIEETVETISAMLHLRND